MNRQEAGNLVEFLKQGDDSDLQSRVDFVIGVLDSFASGFDETAEPSAAHKTLLDEINDKWWALWESRFEGDLPQIEMLSRFLDDLDDLKKSAPSVARVAKGLALLRTAEKVDAIRAAGFRVDIFDRKVSGGGGFFRCDIEMPSLPYKVITLEDRDTQHAATLAAVAAYEAEFGEVGI